MPVVISEIVTEVVLSGTGGGPQAQGSAVEREEIIEQAARRAAERVLEILRREWDR